MSVMGGRVPDMIFGLPDRKIFTELLHKWGLLQENGMKRLFMIIICFFVKLESLKIPKRL